ncbi:M23 family metallopeptidase [Lysinibacillus xylanilyticus]|uniref:M23 family metallopeptidase n=1 Tax=Lysinibacillus xylanilyticus TaxID=582475 RepID=UPI002E243C6E|nr:M23 family metallopeptidase [Lysinibacillus xylanilyticus]
MNIIVGGKKYMLLATGSLSKQRMVIKNEHEQNCVQICLTLIKMLITSTQRKMTDIQSVAGNYIIMECADKVYAGLVHLQTGSIQVSAGQRVKKGEFIGRFGHSGNSFAPHLHFQLMDSSDIATANGLPFAFEQYEIFKYGIWYKINYGLSVVNLHLPDGTPLISLCCVYKVN